MRLICALLVGGAITSGSACAAGCTSIGGGNKPESFGQRTNCALQAIKQGDSVQAYRLMAPVRSALRVSGKATDRSQLDVANGLRTILVADLGDTVQVDSLIGTYTLMNVYNAAALEYGIDPRTGDPYRIVKGGITYTVDPKLANAIKQLLEQKRSRTASSQQKNGVAQSPVSESTMPKTPIAPKKSAAEPLFLPPEQRFTLKKSDPSHADDPVAPFVDRAYTDLMETQSLYRKGKQLAQQHEWQKSFAAVADALKKLDRVGVAIDEGILLADIAKKLFFRKNLVDNRLLVEQYQMALTRVLTDIAQRII